MRAAAASMLCALAACSNAEAGAAGDDASVDSSFDAVLDGDAAAVDAGDAADADVFLDADVGGETDAAKCTLTDSGPITVTKDGEVVERLRITSTSGAALTIVGHANVVVRDVEILHCNGHGIAFGSATNLHVSNVSIRDTCAPAKGALATEQNGISGDSSTGV